MRFAAFAGSLALVVIVLWGCVAPKGDTVADKRNYVLGIFRNLIFTTIFFRGSARHGPAGKKVSGFFWLLTTVNIKPVIFLLRKPQKCFLEGALDSAQNLAAGSFFFSLALFRDNILKVFFNRNHSPAKNVKTIITNNALARSRRQRQKGRIHYALKIPGPNTIYFFCPCSRSNSLTNFFKVSAAPSGSGGG